MFMERFRTSMVRTTWPGSASAEDAGQKHMAVDNGTWFSIWLWFKSLGSRHLFVAQP